MAAEGIKFAYSTFEEVPEVFDFSNVTDASYMFEGTPIKSVPPIPQDKITNIYRCFLGCPDLTDLELNLPACTRLDTLTSNCASLKSVRLNFDASSVREITPEQHLSYQKAKEQALQEEIERENNA